MNVENLGIITFPNDYTEGYLVRISKEITTEEDKFLAIVDAYYKFIYRDLSHQSKYEAALRTMEILKVIERADNYLMVSDFVLVGDGPTSYQESRPRSFIILSNIIKQTYDIRKAKTTI